MGWIRTETVGGEARGLAVGPRRPRGQTLRGEGADGARLRRGSGRESGARGKRGGPRRVAQRKRENTMHPQPLADWLGKQPLRDMRKNEFSQTEQLQTIYKTTTILLLGSWHGVNLLNIVPNIIMRIKLLLSMRQPLKLIRLL